MYPSFREGLVEYTDGRLFKAAMNYNRVLETVQFINLNNDTLVIASEEMINQIHIGDDVFIYKPDCLKSIAPQSGVNIYKHESMKIADIRRKGAFGIPNSSSAIDNYNQIFTWMGSYQLDSNELLLLSKETNFYIFSGNKKLPASKKNILDLFSKNKEQIKEFIDSKNISFSKEKDLFQLAEYIARL